MPITAPRKPAKRAVGLVLTIQETSYALRPLACDPISASRAFRLRKSDGTLYDVSQTDFGPACDCPDFVFRRDGLDPAGCKHVQALAAHGLIEPNPAS
jgi:hypothetical protein